MVKVLFPTRRWAYPRRSSVQGLLTTCPGPLHDLLREVQAQRERSGPKCSVPVGPALLFWTLCPSSCLPSFLCPFPCRLSARCSVHGDRRRGVAHRRWCRRAVCPCGKGPVPYTSPSCCCSSDTLGTSLLRKLGAELSASCPGCRRPCWPTGRACPRRASTLPREKLEEGSCSATKRRPHHARKRTP